MGIMAIAAVAALGMIANRYAAVVQRQEASQKPVARQTGVSSEPLRQVDAFIAVETATGEHERALTEAGIDEPDYQRVRELCKQWKDGAATPRAYHLAFERRRIELDALDLD